MRASTGTSPLRDGRLKIFGIRHIHRDERLRFRDAARDKRVALRMVDADDPVCEPCAHLLFEAQHFPEKRPSENFVANVSGTESWTSSTTLQPPRRGTGPQRPGSPEGCGHERHQLALEQQPQARQRRKEQEPQIRNDVGEQCSCRDTSGRPALGLRRHRGEATGALRFCFARRRTESLRRQRLSLAPNARVGLIAPYTRACKRSPSLVRAALDSATRGLSLECHVHRRSLVGTRFDHSVTV